MMEHNPGSDMAAIPQRFAQWILQSIEESAYGPLHGPAGYQQPLAVILYRRSTAFLRP